MAFLLNICLFVRIFLMIINHYHYSSESISHRFSKLKGHKYIRFMKECITILDRGRCSSSSLLNQRITSLIGRAFLFSALRIVLLLWYFNFLCSLQSAHVNLQCDTFWNFLLVLVMYEVQFVVPKLQQVPLEMSCWEL